MIKQSRALLALFTPALISRSCFRLVSADIKLPPLENPSFPLWPSLFHATLLQNRTGSLALTELYYDFTGGRNLNIIQNQLGETLYDNERQNGSTFYYYPQSSTCSVIDMGVGLLRPDWLDGANYEGTTEIDTFECDIWTQGTSLDDDSRPFVTYYNIKGSDIPARWVFYDDAQFEVLRWTINETASEETWAIPSYCFHIVPQKDSTVTMKTALTSLLRNSNHGALLGKSPL